MWLRVRSLKKKRETSFISSKDHLIKPKKRIVLKY